MTAQTEITGDPRVTRAHWLELRLKSDLALRKITGASDGFVAGAEWMALMALAAFHELELKMADGNVKPSTANI